MSEAVPAKIRISQAVWQGVPKRRAGHREGPWAAECTEPASRNHQETLSRGSKMLPAETSDTGMQRYSRPI